MALGTEVGVSPGDFVYTQIVTRHCISLYTSPNVD